MKNNNNSISYGESAQALIEADFTFKHCSLQEMLEAKKDTYLRDFINAAYVKNIRKSKSISCEEHHHALRQAYYQAAREFVQYNIPPILKNEQNASLKYDLESLKNVMKLCQPEKETSPKSLRQTAMNIRKGRIDRIIYAQIRVI